MPSRESYRIANVSFPFIHSFVPTTQTLVNWAHPKNWMLRVATLIFLLLLAGCQTPEPNQAQRNALSGDQTRGQRQSNFTDGLDRQTNAAFMVKYHWLCW